MNNPLSGGGLFDTVTHLEQYKYSEKLLSRSFFKQLIVMFLTSLSTFLLVTVDGFVVGQFLGENALNSVNLLSPFTLVIGAITSLVASGSNIVLSKTFGLGKPEKKDAVYRAIVILTGILFITVTFVQIPVAYLMIDSYSISQNIKDLSWQYSIGIMLCNSFSVFTTVGTYLLIASGQGGNLLKLTILESVLHLVLDIVFVNFCNLGVLGAGLGSAVACGIRCIFTFADLQKSLKIFPLVKIKCGAEIKEVLQNGTMEMSSQLAVALQNFILRSYITQMCGLEGITVLSVSSLATNVLTMIGTSFIRAENPLLGILTGSEDWQAARNMNRKVTFLCAAVILLLSVVLIAFPGMMFSFYGVTQITAFEVLAVQFFCTQFLFKSVNNICRNMLMYCGKRIISVVSIVCESALFLIPLALLLGNINPAGIFLSYTVSGLIVSLALIPLLSYQMKKTTSENRSCSSIHFCFHPRDALSVSQKSQTFFLDNGIPSSVAYRAALTVEEIGAYVTEARSGEDVQIVLFIRLYSDSLLLFYLDDGKPAILNKKLCATNIVLGNYNLIEKLASEYSYQNICGFNNFIIRLNYGAESAVPAPAG